jgi:prepilin-type N-terminal cleavage/methylation domain-containing protein/prepilin-type processing-associated H-X9-DG protein
MQIRFVPRRSLRPFAAAHWRRLATGFTLLELLVVIAVLALLAGLLFPVFVRVRERGRQSVCLAHLRQISQAHLLYLQDYDEQLVYWYLIQVGRPKPHGPRTYWTEYLQPYLRSDVLFRDPSGHDRDRQRDWLADYALATWGPGGQGTPENPHYFWPGPPFSLCHVVRPAQTIQFADGRSTMNGARIDSWEEPGSTSGSTYRHSDGSNIVFLDGHAVWMRPSEVTHVDMDARGAYLRYGAADR